MGSSAAAGEVFAFGATDNVSTSRLSANLQEVLQGRTDQAPAAVSVAPRSYFQFRAAGRGAAGAGLPVGSAYMVAPSCNSAMQTQCGFAAQHSHNDQHICSSTWCSAGLVHCHVCEY